MLVLLLLFFAILQGVHTSCPSGFVLVTNGECRGKVDRQSYYYDEVTNNAVAKCKSIDGEIPIIHDDEDQSYWKNMEYYNIPLGLVCNTQSKRWEWIDGSHVDYKPPAGYYDAGLDKECTAGCSWFINDSKNWAIKCDHSTTTYDIWCAIQVDQPTQRDCDNFNNDSEDGACYQIGTAVANWQDAQMECRNYGADLASIHNDQARVFISNLASFIRRLAVSKGTVNGVFLGATISGKGTGFGWIDGSAWDYENFYPGFPIDGLGDCLSMDTLGVAGQWMNMDCSSKLPVACIRQPNASYTDSCSSGPWKEGQIIYSPGYPYDASVPCDYFLTVDAGKKVEVKVQLLEANTCCDHLILTDNYLAGNIVANLTGEISSKTYTTKSSNLMRVSWQPNGGVNVRGFMMSYRAV